MKNKLQAILFAILAGAPFLTALPACTFTRRDSVLIIDDLPLTSAIFCDIEATRRCSTESDRKFGIDISKPVEEGFAKGRSSVIGLDYSPEAVLECLGQPRAIVFLGSFPDGLGACVNPGTFPDESQTVNAACKTWCGLQGFVDGDGNQFRCDFIAWASNGVTAAFTDACTEAGVLRAAFQDPRKVPAPTPTPPFPVTWTAAVGVTVSGADLTKPAAAAPQWGNSGAISTQSLASGEGGVLVTATETTTFRIFGLGNGNLNESFEDIEFGLLLRNDGMLQVVEAGIDRGIVGAYATGNTLEVSVVGGAVQYKNGGALLYTSTVAPAYPLLVDAALFGPGPGDPAQDATLTAARVTF